MGRDYKTSLPVKSLVCSESDLYDLKVSEDVSMNNKRTESPERNNGHSLETSKNVRLPLFGIASVTSTNLKVH